MKKVLVGLTTAAALMGFGACEKRPADEVRDRRAEVAKQERDLYKTEQEKANDVAKTRADADRDLAKTEQDAHQDLANKAQNESERIANAEQKRNERVIDAEHDANKDISAERKDVANAERKLDEAEAKDGIGGSGVVRDVATVTGTIVKTTDDSFTIKEADGDTHRLGVSDATVYGYGDKKLALHDLHDGERVKASYVMANDKPVATRIDVLKQ